MYFKYVILFCAVLLFVDINAYVKRDAPPPDPIDAIKKNMESFKNCVDQSLAQAANDVNVEKHLQPVFNILGDQLNRFSKADLTAPSSSPASFVD